MERIQQLAMDEQIRRLQTTTFHPPNAIFDLKAKRNALSPVCKLPFEMLAYILLHVIPAISPDDDTPYSKYHAHLTLTSVCRHWRRVAIDYAPLWTTILFPCRNPKWISTLVQRSKGSQLSVFIVLEEDILLKAELEVLNLVQSQMHRISNLAIVWEGKINDAGDLQLLPMLSKPAPLLRELSLDALDLDDATPLFNDSVPKLKQLTLVDCCINWRSTLFHANPQLTYFCLMGMQTPRPGLAQFMDILRSMPNLRVLCLRGALPEFEIALSARLSLPFLREITLQDTARECSSFLTSIILSPAVALDLDFECESHNDHQLLMPFLQRVGKGTSDRQEGYIQDLYIYTWQNDALFVSGDVVLLSNLYTREGLQCRFSASDPTSLSPQVHTQQIYDMLNALPLQQLFTIRSIFPQLTLCQWRKTLGNLKELESIAFERSLYVTAPTAFIESLEAQPGTEEQSVSIPLPNLRSLELDTPFNLVDFNHLIECLERRMRLGHPLEYLYFAIRPSVDVPHLISSLRRLGLKYHGPKQ